MDGPARVLLDEALVRRHAINPAFLAHHAIVPTTETDEAIIAAIADADNVEAVEGLRFATGRPVIVRAAPMAEIEQALRHARAPALPAHVAEASARLVAGAARRERTNMYRCVVVDRSGSNRTLTIAAATHEAAVMALVDDGLTPIEVASAGPSLAGNLRQRARIDVAGWIDSLAADLTPDDERETVERIWLVGGDVHVATISDGAGTIADVAPISPDQLGWTLAGSHVAMARRTTIDAAAADPSRPWVMARRGNQIFVLARGRSGASALARRTVSALLIAMLLILTIPVTTSIGARWLTAEERRRIAALGATPATDAEDTDRIRALLDRPSLSGIVAETSARLAGGSTVHAISRDRAGRIVIEIDSADPEAARAAIPPGLRLAAAGQSAVTDRGMRSRFESRR